MKQIKYTIVALLLLSFLNACIKNDKYVINSGLKADDIIKIVSISPDTFIADSFSKITVRVAVAAHTERAVTVGLRADQGMINGKTQSETANVTVPRFVDFILTPGQLSGPVQLRATVLDSFFRDTIIVFNKAYPDSIFLKPDSHMMEGDAEMDVVVNFFRKAGYPSANQTFVMQAIDSVGNDIGTFSSSEAYHPGNKINAVFKPESAFAGTARLIVTLIKEDGSRLEGMSLVQVQ